MRQATGEGSVKSLEGLVEERQALEEKERQMIVALNEALGRMGYTIVSTEQQQTPRRGRPRGRRRGRPPGRTTRQPDTAGPRRRGRPPKERVAA